MKQFGILTNLEVQQGLIITQGLNKLVDNNAYIDPVVFYKDYQPQLIRPMFCLMQDVEAWNFPHTLIATNIDTLTRLSKCNIPTKKLFYVFNLEWLYLKEQNYDSLRDIYNVDLIVRSRDHFDIVEKCWKRPLGIVQDTSFETIVNYI